MHIDVNSKEFLENLTIVSSIVNPKIGELVKKQVLIVADKDKTTTKTFNDYTVLSGEINSVIHEAGSICLDLFYLISLVGKLNGTITIKLLDNKVVQISCGRSKYKTTMYPIEDFLEYCNLFISKGREIEVELAPFQTALNCVYSSSLKDDNDLSGSYIYHEGDTDFITCSNSEVGATVRKDKLIGLPEGVFPRFLIDFILKLKDVRFLHLEVNTEGYFSGRAGKYSFVYRAPSYNYPWKDIYELIKNSDIYDSSFKFVNGDLLNILARISVIADPDSHAVKLLVKGDTMIVSAEGPGNYGEEVIDLLSTIPGEYSIIVDSIYLYNILKDFAGTVEWLYTSEDMAQFITDGYLTKFFMGLSVE